LCNIIGDSLAKEVGRKLGFFVKGREADLIRRLSLGEEMPFGKKESVEWGNG